MLKALHEQGFFFTELKISTFCTTGERLLSRAGIFP
jgi:hypothetical protein